MKMLIALLLSRVSSILLRLSPFIQDLFAHLFAKLPQPGDSEGTFPVLR